jgi:hypothetical protein
MPTATPAPLSRTIDPIAIWLGNCALVTFTINDYVVGGEFLNVEEVLPGMGTINGMVIGVVPPTQNSMAIPLLPTMEANGKIVLRRVNASGAEIPSTVGLNAKITLVVRTV